jgi:hypothetical protein
MVVDGDFNLGSGKYAFVRSKNPEFYGAAAALLVNRTFEIAA